MVQYYTLQEAAAKLQISPEQLKEMAKKNEVRAFQDRGNLRFRAPEIDEIARSRGLGSDPDLQYGEVAPKSSGPKSPGPKAPRSTKNMSTPSDQEFELSQEAGNDEVPIGQDPSSGSSGSKNTPRNTNTRSPKPKRSGLEGPSPVPLRQPGSDSDVRLVGEGSGLDFQVDSNVTVEKSPPPAGPKSPSSRKSKVDSAPDSGVRIVPLDEASDSDVKIVPDDPDSNVPLGQSKSKTPSDSDIRLEELHTDSGKSKRDERNLVTEEIDLDAEEIKAVQEAAARAKAAKPKPRTVGSSSQLPTVSPFELSDPDVNLTPKMGAKTGSKGERGTSKVDAEKKKKPQAPQDSSSDFELTPLQDLSSSPLELGSDEMSPITLDNSDEEEVGLGELTGPGAGSSGINLKDPVDSGISLEQGGSDEMEIELNLDAGATPKPKAKGKSKIDSSSEFELSLDDSDAAEEEGSSSEFELTLDEPSSPTEEGSSSEFELSLDLDESSSEERPALGDDSEFELTIDEGGALEDDAELQEEDKDIFETDFEVPALEEESGSEAVALDESEDSGETDLESSDFDLDVDEDSDTEAESGSEVVALDEEGEEVEEPRPAAKKKKGGRTVVAEDEEEPADFEEMGDESEASVELEEEEEQAPVATAAPAEWGVLPVLFATPCAIIMIFVCLMSYEMMAGMWGYHKGAKTSSLILDPVARMFDDTLPKE